MRASQFPLLFVLLVIASSCFPSFASENSFLAYSLKEAKNRLNAEPDSAEVHALGGITHLMGIVHDAERDDLILVGEVVVGTRPISLDDFVVCLRADIESGSPPVVSLDLAPDTHITGMQAVRFEGGIENSQFALDLLDADVLLKKMGLDMLQVETPGIPSYFALSVDDLQDNGRVEEIVTKIWFVPAEESFTATRAGVSVVKELVIDARTEFSLVDNQQHGTETGQDARPSDELGRHFAEKIASEFRNLCQQHEEFARLDQLFRPAALARSIRKMRDMDPDSRLDFDYWIDQYEVQVVETPKQFPMLQRDEFVRHENQALRMTMQGGIALDGLVADLNAGDAEAFRKAVLLKRPQANPLFWPVSLDNWQLRALPGLEDDAAKAAAERVRNVYRDKLACSFVKRIEPAHQQDRMQQRLTTVRSGLQRQIQQPHALDLVQHAKLSRHPIGPSVAARAHTGGADRTTTITRPIGPGGQVRSPARPATSKLGGTLATMSALRMSSLISSQTMGRPTPGRLPPAPSHLVKAYSATRVATPSSQGLQKLATAHIRITPTHSRPGSASPTINKPPTFRYKPPTFKAPTTFKTPTTFKSPTFKAPGSSFSVPKFTLPKITIQPPRPTPRPSSSSGSTRSRSSSGSTYRPPSRSSFPRPSVPRPSMPPPGGPPF